MPKAKTVKRSSASKSKSNKGLRKRFDLSNKKVQFFVVIAIVALLGGGWFTYKSFAASGIRYATYNFANNNLNGGPQSGGTYRTVKESSKDGISVLELNGSALAFGVDKGELGSTINNGKHYLTCALVKRVSGQPTIAVSGPGSAYAKVHKVNSTSFTEYCAHQGPAGGQSPSVINQSNNGNVIRVSAIYINEVSAPVQPPSTPSK